MLTKITISYCNYSGSITEFFGPVNYLTRMTAQIGEMACKYILVCIRCKLTRACWLNLRRLVALTGTSFCAPIECLSCSTTPLWIISVNISLGADLLSKVMSMFGS